MGLKTGPPCTSPSSPTSHLPPLPFPLRLRRPSDGGEVDPGPLAMDLLDATMASQAPRGLVAVPPSSLSSASSRWRRGGSGPPGPGSTGTGLLGAMDAGRPTPREARCAPLPRPLFLDLPNAVTDKRGVGMRRPDVAALCRCLRCPASSRCSRAVEHRWATLAPCKHWCNDSWPRRGAPERRSPGKACSAVVGHP